MCISRQSECKNYLLTDITIFSALPACIRLVFRKYDHHYLMPYPDHITSFLPVQMQYGASVVDELKIEPAVISFMLNMFLSVSKSSK